MTAAAPGPDSTAAASAPVPAIAAAVRGALSPLVGGLRVDVRVEDVVLPDEAAAPSRPATV